MNNKWRIFVINLGSTSSKVAYCENDKIVYEREWAHNVSELKSLSTAEEIIAFRRKFVMQFLEENSLNLSEMDAIAARGMGRTGSYRHGGYLLTPEVCADCTGGHQGLFASTKIAGALSQEYGVPAYLYDVVPTDEIYDVARVSGIPNHRRRAHSHTLNCRATARRVAEQMGLDFDNSTFIVCHMGGGMGTMCCKNGIIVETYSSEEGSFTPVRAGRIPADFLIKVYTDPKNTQNDINRLLRKNVGLFGHLGTDNCVEIEERIRSGDKKAELVYRAMAYQLSKDIGAMATVAFGKVDAVILTGGIARSKMFTDWIRERVEFIAPVAIIPGSMETEALAAGITRIFNGEEELNSYEDVAKERSLYESCR